MAASILATTAWVSRRMACLFCSTSAADSRSMVTIVEIPNPTIMTATISSVILRARRGRNIVPAL
jgi:hypothetical protein